MSHVLAIDQGTTSTRALVVDARGRPVAQAQRELPQIFPRPGWVEHDAEEIWAATRDVIQRALAAAGLAPHALAAVGITNQRETTVVWERATGRPIHNAIVWQDRRTTEACEALTARGLGAMVADKTGLVIDPYFSATKVAWILDHVPGARARAAAGELAFGTIDSFLVWRLSGGAHVTDATNAARTMLFDIRRQEWDDALLDLFQIPRGLLPAVVDSAGHAADTTTEALGARVPIAGIAGDQQAATVGQMCFAPGSIKSTYGTGCFMLLNTGGAAVASRNRLLTTVAYRLDGKATYAMEGAIFVAGAAIQWLRDGLKLVRNAAESAALAAAADPAARVHFVPAFTGLGAPYWDARARGAILGLTRDTGIAEIVRAALEAVCFQTRELIDAMAADGAAPPVALRVDGGLVVNDWAMQFLADILGVPVERPVVTETTAMGAAYLAGMAMGVFPGLDGLPAFWQRDRRFEPAMSDDERATRYARWRDAVRRVRSSETDAG
ncbi:MAG TPA: glycerol kinase GlpK [Candidatus Sulfotelmatobacter sp.]|nr:glycerol kinase GlpK [Candidatus Sulfotelmatobacter sp.]